MTRLIEIQSSPASARGGRSARARGKTGSKMSGIERRESKISIGDSTEDGDAMEIDTETASGPRESATGSTRRSGRRR